MKATIKTYSTNATIFFGELSFDIHYDYGCDFYDNSDEMYSDIDEKLSAISDAENYNDIRDTLAIVLNRFIKN